MSSLQLKQVPGPGEFGKYHVGDVLHLELQTSATQEGIAEVRTNLGRMRQHLNGVLAEDSGQTCREASDEWHDVPMRYQGDGLYVCDLPLPEVGTFEAKCLYRQKANAKRQWVPGNNLQVRVEPSCTASHNTIYNAFVRQFGPNKSGGWASAQLSDGETFLNDHGYAVLPPSGHFRDLKKEIPFIIQTLGFRAIQLLPVQPTPTTYGRMGQYGSPFAPTDYFSVDPALAEFDRKASPMDQFMELVDCIHAQGGLVLLDLPIDHTGWASTLQTQHPEWFCRDQDGGFTSPGAWGVIWADLCKLDFAHHELWDYLADVFLFWVRRGVDGFRCDAGYMVPRPVWRHIVSTVRRDFPNVIFFLEGLGGTVELTHDLLDHGGMNWAYTELFQVVGTQWVKEYLGMLFSNLEERGVWVNFAETHDNNRLASVSSRWAKMRTALAALTASSGAFGMANGVEWLATEKIDVHGAGSLNWGAKVNLVDYIGVLNGILRSHPAFGKGASRQLVGAGTAVGVLRRSSSGDALAIFNVEDKHSASLEWSDREFAVTDDTVDLLTGKRPQLMTLANGRYSMPLQEGECVCLSQHPLTWWTEHGADGNARQELAAQALRVWIRVHGYGDLAGEQVENLAGSLRQGGRQLVRTVCGGGYAPVVDWVPGRDERRVVMLPAGHFLLVRCDHGFRGCLESGASQQGMNEACRCDDGSYQLLLFAPESDRSACEEWVLRLEEWVEDRVIRRKGAVLLLASQANPPVPLRLQGAELTSAVTGIATNEFGGYGLVRGRWGELQSKYDGMLAAGLSTVCPIDRMLVLSRCRAWVVFRDVSIELSASCEEWFASSYSGAMEWGFKVPVGFGGHVCLSVRYDFAHDRNGGRLSFTRLEGDDGFAGKSDSVELIVRPDVDWRVNHEETRAYAGAEQAYPAAVHSGEGGFRFVPGGTAGLWMRSDRGEFFKNGEWHYQVYLPEDAQRGLPGKTDVFSPGYFRFELKEKASAVIELGIGEQPGTLGAASKLEPLASALPLDQCLKESLDLYIARRDENKTVIAGFPWFLDWGRDTLICLRGLVAAGELEASRDIIRAFASFEEGGTIPNMIRGKDSGDRATSDAPLWLLVAAEDLVKAYGKDGGKILDMDCHGRPLKAILESVVRHCQGHLSNGIYGDPATGLIFSPSHYTWMDTNYPAASPRQGYPVEIQALWIHALGFLREITGDASYGELQDRAQRSFLELFVRPDGKGLSDCLHGQPGQGARDCQADDAVRPNQLLAVILCDFLPRTVAESVLVACEGLLMPGGIRSLSDQPVEVELPVVRDGVLLNDPRHPYQGVYGGDEDTCRKAAYHNGTGWGWQFPLFSEALFKLWGEEARSAAASWLTSVMVPMTRFCLGHIPEIYDGDAPHTGRGCPAQAWSMFESYRVWKLLNEE